MTWTSAALISDWFYEDSTATTRAAFLAEVTMRVEERSARGGGERQKQSVCLE